MVEPVEDADSRDRLLVDLALTMREPPFDVQDDGHRHLVFVDHPHEPKRVVKAVMHALAESDAVKIVVTPLRVGRWRDAEQRYVFPDGQDLQGHRPEQPPAVEPGQIGWVVEVLPASVWDWQTVREEVARSRRQVVRETDHMLEVAAGDETDAVALATELRKLETVRAASIRALSRFRRWQVRQQLLGNYEGVDSSGLIP